MAEKNEMKIEKVKDGKVVETFTFENKEDAIGHIIGLMESYDITSEELQY